MENHGFFSCTFWHWCYNHRSEQQNTEGLGRMLETFLMTLEKMMEILGLLALGYLFNKLKLVPRTAEPVLSKFVTFLFLPCLTLYSNIVEFRVDLLGDYAILILVGGAFCVATIGMSYLTAGLFEKKRGYMQNVYRYALTVPNTGAVATPLVLALFGQAGLVEYGMFTFVLGILTNSWGLAQLVPSHGKTTFWSNMRKCFNLQFFAKVIGILLAVVGAKYWLPQPVLNVCSNLSDCYVTVSLLLTGFSLADFPLNEIFGKIKVYWFILWRMVALPCIFLLVLLVFEAPLMMAIMLAITYASPCGMNVIIFPTAYGEECPPDGASMVLISTLVSMVSVPLIYALVQVFFT